MTFYIFRELEKTIEGNSEERKKVMNVVLTICEQIEYFPGLSLLTMEICRLIENEEKAFWILTGLLSQPWVTPFISKNKIYGLEFHLYAIAYIIKSSFKDLPNKNINTSILDIICQFTSTGKTVIPIILDIFVTVLLMSEGNRMDGLVYTKL